MTPVSQSLSSSASARIVLFVALAHLALQMSLLAGGVRYIAVSLAIDDTYYYLQSAWNTKHLGFVTFDGLHPTNGVQLAWFSIILALAMLVPTKTALLVATLAVTFLLNGLCYLVIWNIGSLLQRPGLAVIMAGLWSLQSLPFRIYSMGMENSLHALVFWCVVWQCTVFLLRVRSGEAPNWLGLTAILILNAWTRLDSALFSIIFYCFCLGAIARAHGNNLSLLWRQHRPAIIGSALLAAAGAVVQLAAFQLMGGTPLPVSALVKTDGVIRGLSSEAADKLFEVLMLGMPSVLQGRLPALALIALALFGIVLVIRQRSGKRQASQRLLAFLDLWLCMLGAELLYHLAIALSGVQYTPYFIWYRSPTFIFWTVTASLCVLFSIERVARARWATPRFRVMPAAFGLLAFAASIYLFGRSINFSSGLYVARYDVAKWVADNYPPDTTFAAWNTGQLGYFSNRTFINLDGVINDTEFYERVLRGPVPLVDYLAENDVDYVIDYDTYGSMPDFPVVRTFPIPDGTGRSIQVWQLSSPLSAAP